jgi:hypothetical protein
MSPKVPIAHPVQVLELSIMLPLCVMSEMKIETEKR